MNILNRMLSVVKSSEPPELDVHSVNEQVWRDIFLRCDVKTLFAVSQVCSLFHKILSDSQFWTEKCELDGIRLPPLAWRRFVRSEEAAGTADSPIKNFNYMRIAMKNPYYRNLGYELKPDVTLQQLETEYPVQFHGGGQGFVVESPGVYCANDPDVSVCLATSYGWCERYFELDLVKMGIEEWILDHIRPVINVSEMFICRQDCGANYEIYVQLLMKDEMFDRMVELPRFKHHEASWRQWEGGLAWEKIAFQFSEYPKGVRRVGILTRGKDSQFWAGHYGPKFTNTRIVVEFPEEVNVHGGILPAMSSSECLELDVHAVNDQAWRDIFLRCDAKSLVAVSQVCSLFHYILSDSQFWTEKCELEGIRLPPLAWRRFVRSEEAAGTADSPIKNFNYMRIAMKNPYYRNLGYELKPGVTLQQLETEYQIHFDEGGDGFVVESPGVYCANDPDVSVCLATSYGWCERYFELDLVKMGIEEWILDHIRPVINVSEMFICRQDCGANYEIYVQLLMKDEMFDRMVELPRFKHHEASWRQWEGGLTWEKIAFQFSEYPKGVRRVGILTRGKDSQFWAGHYGPKFTNTRIVVEFPDEVRYKTEDEFSDPEQKLLGEPRPHRLRLRHDHIRQGRFRYN